MSIESTTPVATFVFNRPDVTRRMLDAVRLARPPRLFVVADGPRADRPDDPDAIARTRAVFDEVDWPCDVVRLDRPTNVGVEPSVETGLDWLFEQVDTAIVLEDDCVADPSFFTFADQLLDRYREDPRVWQVSGHNFGAPGALFGSDSYRFTAWASVWGWATWANRWQQHRASFTRTHADASQHQPVRTTPVDLSHAALTTASAQRHFAEASTSDDIISHGWDKHWWLTMMTEGALAVTPAVNLVENIGWGADATHGTSSERQDHGAHTMPFPLTHPADVAVDLEVERELELVLSRVGGRTARLARRLVRHPGARRVARAVAYSRPVVALTRLLSRLASKVARR